MYSIYQENVFRLLREGTKTESKLDFFYNVVSVAVEGIAKANNSEVTLSPSRVWEVHELWDDDLRALIRNEKIEGSEYPCAYKHAAFLTYWLRRRVIVESKRPIDVKKGVVNDSFNKYTNEYLALMLGIRLAMYHHYVRPGFSEHQTVAALKKVDLPQDLMKEGVVYLHHKNVSPHSLYLFFKALFVQLPPPKVENPRLQSV